MCSFHQFINYKDTFLILFCNLVHAWHLWSLVRTFFSELISVGNIDNHSNLPLDFISVSTHCYSSLLIYELVLPVTQVVSHMMPDLPNVGLERDIEQFIVSKLDFIPLILSYILVCL